MTRAAICFELELELYVGTAAILVSLDNAWLAEL
jgi:hypothetical protein